MKWVFLSTIFLVAAYFSFIYLTRNYKSEEVIVVGAEFMQYLCGPEIDDMKVHAVNSSFYQYFVGKDIDPQILPSSIESELKGYFYDN